jgi:hypothetical protein
MLLARKRGLVARQGDRRLCRRSWTCRGRCPTGDWHECSCLWSFPNWGRGDGRGEVYLAIDFVALDEAGVLHGGGALGQ